MSGPRHVSQILPNVIANLVYQHNTNLTDKQRQYAEFMFAFFEENDQLPSNVAIAEHFGCAPSTVGCHVQALARKGVLKKNALGKYKRGPAFPVRRI